MLLEIEMIWVGKLNVRGSKNMIITRATLRGKPLDDDCKIAKISKHEYGLNDDRCYCYGLVDCSTDDTLEKCRTCGAYCMNAKPLN